MAVSRINIPVLVSQELKAEVNLSWLAPSTAMTSFLSGSHVPHYVSVIKVGDQLLIQESQEEVYLNNINKCLRIVLRIILWFTAVTPLFAYTAAYIFHSNNNIGELARSSAPQNQPLLTSSVAVPKVQEPQPQQLAFRKGFPNPSNTNCPYNSLGIVVAHSRFLDSRLERFQTFPVNFIGYQAALKEKAGLEGKLQKLDVEKEGIIKESQQLEQEIERLKQKRKIEGKDYDARRNELKQSFHSEQELDIQCPMPQEVYAIDYQIKTRELKKPGFKSRISGIENEKETTITKIRRSTQKIENFEKFSGECRAALRILKILRGEEEGELTEGDAKLLSSLIDKFVKSNVVTQPYSSPREVRQDSNCTKLRNLLYDRNWQVIRIGGNRHFYAYVRNNNNTVDEVNDLRVVRSVKTFDQIFTEWSNPDRWSRGDIAFSTSNPKFCTDEELNDRIFY